MKSLIIFPIFIIITWGEVVKYNGYRVYRTEVCKEVDIQKFRSLEVWNQNYSIWSSVSNPSKYVDIMVAPESVEHFVQMFPNTKLYINDVQKLIDNERPKINSKAKRGMSWEDYFTYDEINDWLNKLVQEFPTIVSLINVGKSYEGRDIIGVHVSYHEKNKQKGVLLESGMHAREWIGVATVTYQLNELLRSSDPVIREIAENHDWYIFPIFNPDGYSYTFTRNRMWRKTRQPYGICYGADPNRNWAYKWHEGDYNYINPCSETFAGSRAFSEPETKALSEYFKTIGSNLLGYISHHAYSQVLLLPYGDSNEHKDNYNELYSVGKKMAEEIKKVNGTEYKVGNIVDIMCKGKVKTSYEPKIKFYLLVDKATGNNVDWIKNSFKTRMTYIYELRDTGKYGFLLPASQIIPSGKEAMVGLITMFTEFQKIDENVKH